MLLNYKVLDFYMETFFFKWLITMIAYSSLTKIAEFHSQFLMRQKFPSLSYCISHQFLTFSTFFISLCITTLPT